MDTGRKTGAGDGRRVITVFGSSRVRRASAGYDEALELGRELAGAGFGVCSGGYGGVMEAVSRGAAEGGGAAVGVTARAFRARANGWISREIRVGSWRERLFELVRQGSGYVVCAGGTGTLVELAVTWELLNKGMMRGKPLVVLGPFWIPVVEQVNRGEGGRSSEGPTRGEGVIYRAATAADAARFLAERLGAGRG